MTLRRLCRVQRWTSALVAEHLGDRRAQRLRTIDHGEDAVLEAQPASDEIGEQVGDDDLVLGVTETEPDGHLRPVAVMTRATTIISPGDVEPVDHHHRRLQPGQVRFEQLGDRRLGRGDEPARHRRLRHRRAGLTDRFGDFDMTAGGDTGEHPLDHDLAQQILGGERRPRRPARPRRRRRSGHEAVRR